MGGGGGPVKFNWNMFRSSVVALCCFFPCGLIGIIYALLSYVDYNHNNMKMYVAVTYTYEVSMANSVYVCICVSVI